MIHVLLEDTDEDRPVAASKALALVGDRRSITVLERALEFDEWCLQVEAWMALATLERRRCLS